MHRTFVFPIKCFSPQLVPSTTGLEQRGDKFYIVNQLPKDGDVINFQDYDAMDDITIIPSVINLVEKVLKGEKKTKAIKQWSEQRGLLNSSNTQSVEEIWTEFYKFYMLWDLYKGVVNKESETLDMYIKARKHTDNEYEVTVFEGERFEDQFSWYHISSAPMEEYAILYLTGQIEENIQKCSLFSYRLGLTPGRQQDAIEITPALRVSTLLEAIYMQFFILLSENTKKICPVCNKPFLPERQGKTYCSSTCKLTAKSRRVRSRKASSF